MKTLNSGLFVRLRLRHLDCQWSHSIFESPPVQGNMKERIQCWTWLYIAEKAIAETGIPLTTSYTVWPVANDHKRVAYDGLGKDRRLSLMTEGQSAFGRWCCYPVLIIGCFTQAWISLIADKVDSTLESFSPSGKGFKGAATR